MTDGTKVPSAAPPIDAFAAALAIFHQAQENHVTAKQKVEWAQAEQAAAINALPEADRADMAQLEAIADRMKIHELGEAAFATMEVGDAALEALVAIPAPSVHALFEKMRATFGAGWETGDHSARLLADAATLSLQFGHLWLARWTEKGGSVTMDRTEPGKAWIGHPEYHCSPGSVADEARLEAAGVPEDQRQWQRTYLSAHYSGSMRELSDMLDMVPGALAAVKAIVATDPTKGLGEAVRAALKAPSEEVPS